VFCKDDPCNTEDREAFTSADDEDEFTDDDDDDDGNDANPHVNDAYVV